MLTLVRADLNLKTQQSLQSSPTTVMATVTAQCDEMPTQEAWMPQSDPSAQLSTFAVASACASQAMATQTRIRGEWERSRCSTRTSFVFLCIWVEPVRQDSEMIATPTAVFDIRAS
jgi:hypothetical protein